MSLKLTILLLSLILLLEITLARRNNSNHKEYIFDGTKLRELARFIYLSFMFNSNLLNTISNYFLSLIRKILPFIVCRRKTCSLLRSKFHAGEFFSKMFCTSFFIQLRNVRCWNLFFNHSLPINCFEPWMFHYFFCVCWSRT